MRGAENFPYNVAALGLTTGITYTSIVLLCRKKVTIAKREKTAFFELQQQAGKLDCIGSLQNGKVSRMLGCTHVHKKNQNNALTP